LQLPIIHKLPLTVLAWSAEVVLSSIATALSQEAADFVASVIKENVMYTNAGIGGLIAIALFIIIAILLILFYTKRLRIKYKETSIDVYARNGGQRLDEFLNKAKREIHIFGITLEETTGSFINVIESKVRSPDIRRIRIILFDPKNTDLREKVNQLTDSNRYCTGFVGTLAKVTK
jgi:hypothetical protein